MAQSKTLRSHHRLLGKIMLAMMLLMEDWMDLVVGPQQTADKVNITEIINLLISRFK